MKRFLKTLSNLFGASINSNILGPVEDKERITRYIFSRSHFNKERVKYGAFMPAPDGHSSVYRTSEIAEKEIWDIGDKYVARARGKNIRSRGDLQATVAFSQHLSIEPAPNPHPRHANLADWPTDRDEQMQIAIELAAAAHLSIKK